MEQQIKFFINESLLRNTYPTIAAWNRPLRRVSLWAMFTEAIEPRRLSFRSSKSSERLADTDAMILGQNSFQLSKDVGKVSDTRIEFHEIQQGT